MNIIVKKYGGSSLSSPERIQEAAKKIITSKKRDDRIVVVCSAMGDSTDHLMNLASKVSNDPDKRDLDLLISTGEVVASTLMALALTSLNYRAISLTGAQAGIHTDSNYGMARIDNVDPERVLKELDKDTIVTVAGFQGVSSGSDTTTLGRGGSDITAIALAISVKANICEIYTDVDGIYTADPRILPQARKLTEVSYENMLEMAFYGAKMPHRSIELAALYNMPIKVASSFNDNPGTLIHSEENMETQNRATAIGYDMNVSKVTILGVADRPGIAASIFEPLAEAGISVDTIVQNASVENLTDITFTMSGTDLEKSLEVINNIAKEIGTSGVVSSGELGKVSIIGTGMQGAPGYASSMFSTLSKIGINIEMITTSEIRITCIIERDKVEKAVRALHEAFDLEEVD